MSEAPPPAENLPEEPARPPRLYCGNCGTPIPPGRHFCPNCLGPASLAVTTPPAPPAPAPISPGPPAALPGLAAPPELAPGPKPAAAPAAPVPAAAPVVSPGPPAIASTRPVIPPFPPAPKPSDPLQWLWLALPVLGSVIAAGFLLFSCLLMAGGRRQGQDTSQSVAPLLCFLLPGLAFTAIAVAGGILASRKRG